MNRNNNGTTGKLFELEILYATGRYPDLPNREIPYQPLRQAIMECIEKHPGYTKEELSDPPSLWMNDVLYVIAEEMDVPMNAVQIFPALGTAADRYHGIDFFVLFTAPSTGEQVIVTIDLSERDVKLAEGYKADMIVSSMGAAPKDTLYSGFRAFKLEEKPGASRMEDYEQRKEHRIRVAHLIVDIIREKLVFGDLHYSNLYHHTAHLRHDIKQCLENVRAED